MVTQDGLISHLSKNLPDSRVTPRSARAVDDGFIADVRVDGSLEGEVLNQISSHYLEKGFQPRSSSFSKVGFVCPDDKFYHGLNHSYDAQAKSTFVTVQDYTKFWMYLKDKD